MTLTTQTFDSVPGGMNLALPAQEIDDSQARYLQDILLDQPGIARRRGPVQAVSTISAVLPRKGTNFLAALNPAGTARFAVLTGDNSTGFLTVYDSALATTVDLALPFALPAAPGSGNSYRVTDIKPALRGGAWFGVSSAYDANAVSQMLGLWFGGTKANATITVTGTKGSQTVTGTGLTAGVDPGQFLFANTDDPYAQAYIGVVKSVDSNTSLTLVAVSPYTFTAKSGTFQSIRGFAPKVAKGHLTTDTAAATVTGGATKFRSQKLDAGTVLTGTMVSGLFTVTAISPNTTGLTPGMPVTGTSIGASARIATVDSSTQVTLTVANTGSTTNSVTFKVPWDLYRASDGTWIGTVLSVQSEIGLTMLANAAISLSDEAFFALRADANYALVTTGSTQKAGFITANYADRQWYFNNGGDYATTSRGWFSDPADGEMVDMSAFDGDWLDVVSTSNVNEPIRGAQAAYNGLLIHKETETFILTGSSPASFGVRKLEDDGAISGGSIQAYAGGVIWAGREGIHLYDGIQSNNLTAATLGDYYRNTIRTFDPTKYRMWSVVDRDHYMLFVESIVPTVPVVKGNVSTTPTKYTIVVNMITRAVSTFINVDIRGGASIPGSSGRSMWYLVNGQVAGDATDHGIICDGEALFNQEGIDPVYSDFGAITTPWTNLVLNGDFETNTTGWGGSAGTIVQDTSVFKRGKASLKVITSASAFQSTSGATLTLTGAQAYTISAWLFVATGATVRFGFFSPTLGTQAVNVVGTSAWQKVTVTFTPGSTAADWVPFVDTGAAGVATTFWLDAVQVETGSVAHEFVNGTDAALGFSGLVAGPDYYIESKKFDAADGLLLKRFKQLAVWYLAQGDFMKVDVVLGLNNIGQTLTGNFPVSGFTWDTLHGTITSWDNLKAQFATWSAIVQSVFVPKRVRFQKRNQFMAFRLYQNSSAVTRIQTGPFQIGYKPSRPGRI